VTPLRDWFDAGLLRRAIIIKNQQTAALTATACLLEETE
jgi:hypothetical protein